MGYFADAIPYAFHNPEGELVGYDVEMAHLLAREMRVGLEFVPIERATAPDSLRSGQCDIVMSGYLISVQRAERVEFSHSYLQERLGFLVEDHRRGQFRNLGALAGERLRIAVPNVEGTFDTLSRWLPNVEQVPISSYDEVVAKSHELDAILIPIERAQYWSRVHPELSAVLPEEDTGSALVAYGLPVGGGGAAQPRERLARRPACTRPPATSLRLLGTRTRLPPAGTKVEHRAERAGMDRVVQSAEFSV